MYSICSGALPDFNEDIRKYLFQKYLFKRIPESTDVTECDCVASIFQNDHELMRQYSLLQVEKDIFLN
jgi:hypothetical protein